MSLPQAHLQLQKFLFLTYVSHTSFTWISRESSTSSSLADFLLMHSEIGGSSWLKIWTRSDPNTETGSWKTCEHHTIWKSTKNSVNHAYLPSTERCESIRRKVLGGKLMWWSGKFHLHFSYAFLLIKPWTFFRMPVTALNTTYSFHK